MGFKELGICENITQALLANKITEPTEIQEQVIPHLLCEDQDIVAIAQTGTGKTAAYCLPILQTIDHKETNIQALVLVPTRELGQQVAREFFLFSKFMPRTFAEAVYGGTPIEDQILKLKRTTHIVVATPGRLLDLIDKDAIKLDNLKYLVLDEADEMINMGFKSEIDQILASCNGDYLSMLFTATMPTDVKQIVREYLRPNTKEIRIKALEFINQKIEHQYFIYKHGFKLDYLKAYLSERIDQRGIMFCRTKTTAKKLAKQLAGFDIVADALHGNLNQEMRDKVMRGFKKERINLLVATDIAARGIDVKDLDYVIHYDLPEKAEQYTHRSGRTARAGKSGTSICMINEEEIQEIKAIESKLNIQFSRLEVTPVISKSSNPVTIYMNIGFGQGFTKANLTEFLVEEAGLHTTDIKNIVVEDNRSYFDIPEKYQKQVFLNIKGYKLAHRNLKLTLDGANSKRNIY